MQHLVWWMTTCRKFGRCIISCTQTLVSDGLVRACRGHCFGPQFRVASSHSNSFVMVMPPPSLVSVVVLPSPCLLLFRACTVVVVRHISSSSGLQALECWECPSSVASTSSFNSVNCEAPSVSRFEILRVRFLPIVSMGLRLIEREPLPLEDRSEGMKLNQEAITCRSSGRRVGRQPDMMPIEGSTEDQMNTSLLAQLMSVVVTSRVIVMMRYMEAKHTLVLSATNSEDTFSRPMANPRKRIGAHMLRVRTNFQA